MTKSNFKDVTIITSARNKFLKLKENEDSVALIGKPIRIIFSNEAEIPELEEESKK